MKIFYDPKKSLTYTGAELRPHFLLSEFKIEGSGLVAFRGACQVQTEKLVDWEDRLNSDSIRAKEMLHVLVEFFVGGSLLGGMGLREGVLAQRLLMVLAHEELLKIRPTLKIRREGDDLFVFQSSSQAKLSVSIATVSTVSVLIHAGINIDAQGAPVAAIGLKDLDVDPDYFAQAWLKAFKSEWDSVTQACTKVRGVL